MMANRKERYESSRPGVKNPRRHIERAMFSSSSSEDEAEVTTGCRSCRNTTKEHFFQRRIEPEQLPAGQEGLRRETNSFSFKHFLENVGQPNYQNTGARPKVYSPPTTSPHNAEKDTAVYSCNPTELPDFVQDHLVIEQCYLNHEPKQQIMPEIDNLPDFALNSVEQKHTRLRNDAKKDAASVSVDLPFDLTGTLEKGVLHRNHSLPANPGKTIYNRCSESSKRPDPSGFPLDLPLPELPLSEADFNLNNTTRDGSAAGETDILKSLPDFLNDGPIHSRTTLTDTGMGSNANTVEKVNKLLQGLMKVSEERDFARRQISEKNKRIQLLESELASRRELEREETAELRDSVEHDDDSLKRNARMDATDEGTIASLKKEIQTLTTEVSQLRIENRKLRSAAAGAGSNEGGSSNVDRTVRRLAGDLRNAASSAEMSLRQLMSGVDNLRVLASALENVDKIEDRTKDFLSHPEEDNAAGPAL